MTITLETAFRRARNRMPRRRGGIYDPGIMVRIDFARFDVQVNTPPEAPAHHRPPPSLFGPNADDLRTIWEFWPRDRQKDWNEPDAPAGAPDMLVSATRSVRTGLARDGAFLGQFRIVQRPGLPHLFMPTHPTLAAFASSLELEGDGGYRVERTITGKDVEAARPPGTDLKNPPVMHTGWISLKFFVTGVAYVA